ncbi:MAG TPA: amino acid permease, partial [Gemmataceae bacterium]|nr:amino acid permease [Gemmataceae bacterium]
MFWNKIFATKTLEMLDAEAKGENRLRRVLGPVALTSLGVGAIIGAGIFVMTGRVAANDAGPGVLVSFAIAGVACALAAFCYSEFASMAPVAGSAYTYAYATLGELFAWIIGWDLILEYAMSAATVASVWSNYLNKLLKVLHIPPVPEYLCSDPFSTPGAIMNLPAVLVLAFCTIVLVIGIRESAATNTTMVLIKLGVVLFVIVIGFGYVHSQNWFTIPADGRKMSEQTLIPKIAHNHANLEHQLLQTSKDWAKTFVTDKNTAEKLNVDAVLVNTNNSGLKTLVPDDSAEEKGGLSLESKDAVVERSKLLASQALATFIIATADSKLLQGIWKNVGADKYVDTITFNDHKFDMKLKNGNAIEGTYALDPTQKTKGIMLIVPPVDVQKKGKTLYFFGTYERNPSGLRFMAKFEVGQGDKAIQIAVDTSLEHETKENPAESEHWAKMREKYANKMPTLPKDRDAALAIIRKASQDAPDEEAKKWGMVAQFGVTDTLKSIDNSTRSNFMPYGISGVMLGAALVFFAFIGFDSISTHSEEAIRPQRDVPIGILASLGICTVLYILVSAVITGMVPYYAIDTSAAIASAFTDLGEHTQSKVLNLAGGLIAFGAIAGMTSVLLITFLSQSRIFLAMARDGLMPHAIFGAVHDKFKTPHVSTILTGTFMSIVAAFTPISLLEEMVNIGTLFAFVVVCAAVLILRIKRPEAPRPFKCPLLYVVAPAGILVNLTLMFFLPFDTWMRLFVWLGIGLCIYFAFGYRFSVMRQIENGTA